MPKLHLLYTADVAGAVPSKHLSSADEGQRKTTKGEESIEFLDIGNGDLPPEWTIEAAMYGGSIHYGPWADRQRVQLQRVFFPLAYQDVEPFAGISEGNTRICTCLKIFFELRDNTTLVVPFREASKVSFAARTTQNVFDCPRIGCGTMKLMFFDLGNIGRLRRSSFALVISRPFNILFL